MAIALHPSAAAAARRALSIEPALLLAILRFVPVGTSSSESDDESEDGTPSVSAAARALQRIVTLSRAVPGLSALVGPSNKRFWRAMVLSHFDFTVDPDGAFNVDDDFEDPSLSIPLSAVPPQPKSHSKLEERLAVRGKLVEARTLEVGGEQNNLPSQEDYQRRVTKVSEVKLPHHKAGKLRADIKNVHTKLRPLSPSSFNTFEEFDEAWGQYVVNNLAKYSVSTSQSRQAYNEVTIKAYEAQKAAAQKRKKPFAKKLHLLPTHLTHKFSTQMCCHGRRSPARGTGVRPRKSTPFTGCAATIKAEAVHDPATGLWSVVTRNENTTHNHPLDEDMFEMYLNSSDIPEGTVRTTASSMLAAGGEMRRMLDILNRGRTMGKFTRRKLTNFRQNRLGGVDAVLSSNRMVRKFLSLHGSQSLLLKDQKGATIGLVFQTKIQRELFRRYGDSLILDWTHNTNNRGFHLGSLLVTTASGKGVSVLDFLCVSQSKDAMRGVFKHFIATNPEAPSKIGSVVIDKDYREWGVLNEVFPNAEVVLCQFHVLKWFKHVVNDTKYNINHALRPAVIKILRALVYASDDQEFVHQQFVLADLLCAPAHAGFLEYLGKWWYNCVATWSNCRRGNIFTATNTTSNRLESYWKQLKDSLRQRLRMDVCIEAIFLYATSVLSREKEHLQKHKSSTATHPNCHDYVRSLLGDLSEYAGELVIAQWNKFAAAAHGSYMFESAGDPTSPSLYKVYVTEPRHVGEVEVDTASWSCSCHFHRGCLLPCRHLFYSAVVIEKKLMYPPSSVPGRWSLSAALDLLPHFTEAIDELATLRVDLPPPPPCVSHDASDRATTDNDAADDDEEDDAIEFSRFSWPNFAHFQIQRRQASDCVVLEDFEKRNTVDNQLVEIKAFLMGRGTARFTAYAVELGEVLADLLQRWKTELQQPLPVQDAIDEEEELEEREARNAAVAAEEDFGWHDVDCLENEVVFEEDLPVVTPVDQPGVMSIYADAEATSLPFSMSPDTFTSELGDGFTSALADVGLWQTSPFADFDVGLLDEETKDDETPHVSAVREEQVQPAGVDKGNNPSVGVKRLAEQVQPIESQPQPEQPRGSVKRKAQRKLPGPLTFPPVIRQANLKRSKQASSATGRSVFLDQGSRCPVSIDEFVMMLKYKPLPAAHGLSEQFAMQFTDSPLTSKAATTKRVIIHPARPKLNFAIPESVLHVLKTAVRTKRSTQLPHQVQESLEDGDSDKQIQVSTVDEVSSILHRRQYVVRLVGCGDSRDFSEDDIQSLIEFGDAKSAFHDFVRDKQWVASDLRWNGSDGHAWGRIVELGFPESVVTMRREVLQLLETVSLSTVLSFPSTPADERQHRGPTITVRDVIGSVARHKWLNDAIMNFALKRLSTRFRGVVVVDSLLHGNTTVPTESLMRTRVVVFPINYDKQHWCVICVCFAWESDRHRAFLVDPKCSAKCSARIAETWKAWCVPLLDKWCERDNRQLNSALDAAWGVGPQLNARDVQQLFVDRPVQTDGWNCGVLCILQACAFMSNEDDVFQYPKLAPSYLAMLRLRLMWILLCLSRTSTHAAHADQATRTEARFSSYFTALTTAAAAPPPKKPKTVVAKTESYGVLV